MRDVDIESVLAEMAGSAKRPQDIALMRLVRRIAPLLAPDEIELFVALLELASEGIDARRAATMKGLAHLLGEHMDGEGIVYLPSVEAIAAKLEVGSDDVEDALAEFEANGFLEPVTTLRGRAYRARVPEGVTKQ